MTSIMLTDTGR